MPSLKVNEIYSSIQGEGPNVGVATTFVRFGGCNLRCPGWGTYIRNQVHGTIEEVGLPIDKFVGTENIFEGCDTIHAVYPEFRSEWTKMTPTEIIDECQDTAMVTLTGGEPLIQPEDELELLWQLLYNKGHTVEVFTNGTQLLPEWLLNKNKSYIIMDFKLDGSGEYGKFNNLNLGLLRIQDTIKFVCKDQDDIDQAVKYMAVFQNHTDAQFSMGVVWNQFELTEAQLAELLSTDLSEVSLNIQLHKHIWDPQERRR